MSDDTFIDDAVSETTNLILG